MQGGGRKGVSNVLHPPPEYAYANSKVIGRLYCYKRRLIYRGLTRQFFVVAVKTFREKF